MNAQAASLIAPPSSSMANGALPPQLAADVRRLLKEILVSSYLREFTEVGGATVSRVVARNREEDGRV